MRPGRRGLLWFGREPSAETQRACRDRDLVLSAKEGLPTPAEWASARGAVFALASAAGGEALDSVFAEALRAALWHGVKVIVLADLDQVPSVDSHLKLLPFGGLVLRWHSDLETDSSEEVARCDPGPPWSGNVLVEGDSDLGDEDKALIRRAFSDCYSVKLVRTPGGRSAEVFCAYARLKDSRAGPLPLPFFVKLDRFPKIKRELENYRECTTLFVPFNQRPNLDADRCALGAQRGIIVGNFVEESEALRELVERGTARRAIHSLFGGALRGWRSQAHYDDSNTVNAAIVTSLPGCLPSSYPKRRREWLARHADEAAKLGAVLAPDELERMFSSLPPVLHRCALMHGDLHGDNVRVHGTEAILIDFASTGRGPLVADPAALEVSLMMGCNSPRDAAWRALVESAYQLKQLHALPPPPDPTEGTAAFWNNIRLIRQIGLADQTTEFEYATTVALYLLRRASYPPERGEETIRRATAYLLAGRLAEELSDTLSARSGSTANAAQARTS